MPSCWGWIDRTVIYVDLGFWMGVQRKKDTWSGVIFADSLCRYFESCPRTNRIIVNAYMGYIIILGVKNLIPVLWIGGARFYRGNQVDMMGLS